MSNFNWKDGFKDGKRTSRSLSINEEFGMWAVRDADGGHHPGKWVVPEGACRHPKALALPNPEGRDFVIVRPKRAGRADQVIAGDQDLIDERLHGGGRQIYYEDGFSIVRKANHQDHQRFPQW